MGMSVKSNGRLRSPFSKTSEISLFCIFVVSDQTSFIFNNTVTMLALLAIIDRKL